MKWPARQHKYAAGDPSCGSDTEQTPFSPSPASSWHTAPQVRVTATIISPKPQRFWRNRRFWSPRRAGQRAGVGSPGHAEPEAWGRGSERSWKHRTAAERMQQAGEGSVELLEVVQGLALSWTKAAAQQASSTGRSPRSAVSGAIPPLTCPASLQTLGFHSAVPCEFAAAAISGMRSVGTASAAAPGTIGTIPWQHRDHPSVPTALAPLHLQPRRAHSICELRGSLQCGGVEVPQLRAQGGITHPAASVQPHSSCSSPTEHPNGPPCPWVSCERIRHAAAPLSGGCARQRGRSCAVMHRQLAARYCKTLPTGLKRLEKPCSGFSWSHAQRAVPLTLETKCLI